jgi:hypothetical protein
MRYRGFGARFAQRQEAELRWLRADLARASARVRRASYDGLPWTTNTRRANRRASARWK